ncbi:hypothetical protein RIF29_40547 [Crotalaria pallida]|uniref:Uncharacterized protein n=1 Tax=Crotalaria pallida TaxID=3830 RepID=A0AAN9E3B5_CROPI
MATIDEDGEGSNEDCDGDGDNDGNDELRGGRRFGFFERIHQYVSFLCTKKSTVVGERNRESIVWFHGNGGYKMAVDHLRSSNDGIRDGLIHGPTVVVAFLSMVARGMIHAASRMNLADLTGQPSSLSIRMPILGLR